LQLATPQYRPGFTSFAFAFESLGDSFHSLNMANLALRHVSSSPKADDFTPLQEHQAQTPSTFFGGKPVLYAHQAGLTLSAQASRLSADHIFNKFTTAPSDQAGDVLIKDVELWGTSEYALISFPIRTGANCSTGTSSSSNKLPHPPVSRSRTPSSPFMQP
jgi:hypothetical protein